MTTQYLLISKGTSRFGKWTEVIAVCPTEDLAISCKNKIRAMIPKVGISVDELISVEIDYEETYPEDEKIDFAKLSEIAPEHTKEEWEAAYINLEEQDGIEEIYIETIDLINDLTDLTTLGFGNRTCKFIKRETH